MAENFDIPEPRKVAPELTAEQRAAMAPIDLLVQFIMPKLWDKVNFLEWAVKKELHGINQELEFLRNYITKLDGDTTQNFLRMGERVDELERKLNDPSIRDVRKAIDKKDAARSKKRVKVNASPQTDTVVSTSSIARYDPDTDEWVPLDMDGVMITASVVAAVERGEVLPPNVMAFVMDLSDAQKQTLCARFPN